MSKRRRIQLAVMLLVLLATGLTLRWFLSSERLRRNWLREALPEIARLAADDPWIARQTSTVTQETMRKPGQPGAWVADQIAVMQDGQWIVFKNECVHRHQLLGDIFIAKASNGRWYYSTFHFCCEMIVPKMVDPQPADLQSFIKKYFLQEFDGMSDEAIKQTWVLASSPIL